MDGIPSARVWSILSAASLKGLRWTDRDIEAGLLTTVRLSPTEFLSIREQRPEGQRKTLEVRLCRVTDKGVAVGRDKRITVPEALRVIQAL